jgi:hypothetical protein
LRQPDWEIETKRALELAPTASQRERMFIEASNHMLAGQRARALPVLTDLVRLYPDHYFGK